MASISRLLKRNLRNSTGWASVNRNQSTSRNAAPNEVDYEEGEFRVLNLRAKQHQNQRISRKREIRKDETPPPRTQKMAVDQDWTAVWPGPKSFHPASVPLPIRQGYTEKGAAPPSKYANAELMKIPNFLHLTPPAIRQQCEALKRFCTAWPAGLETDELIKQHFPLEVISTDYCHALPTIRHPEARRVTLKVKLSEFKFDAHARDKFLRLVGDRYNPETDVLTIVADRCPLRKQNYDYALYLLTASYHESFVTEPWEATKSEADMEVYRFEHNKSKESAENILNYGKPSDAPKVAASKEFATSVEDLINDGENEYNLNKYKEAVVAMLGFQKK